jgi:hypothetical protein
MDKKAAIVNTLLGKIQARSKAIFEDVSNEMWSFEDDKPAEKDYDLEIDGEEVKEDEKPVDEKPSAMDVILNAQVDDSEKEVSEF